MELRQLEYLVAISETGAFSRAALQLSVTQPVLSRQMRALVGFVRKQVDVPVSEGRWNPSQQTRPGRRSPR